MVLAKYVLKERAEWETAMGNSNGGLMKSLHLVLFEDKWTSVETQTSWKLESCFQPVTSQNSVQTNAAVVSGDAFTRVLNNEVSTVVTTCTSRAATPTDSTVLPQNTSDTQPIFQSDSSNKTNLLFCTTALPF